MFYILCEDSGSGKDFYKGLCRAFLPNGGYLVDDTHGNKGYLSYLDNFINQNKLGHGDSLLLAFDNVESSKTFDVASIIEFAEDISSKRGVSIFYTEYYCFEEVYLSYDGFLEYVGKRLLSGNDSSSAWYSALKYVHDSIQSEQKYYIRENDNVKFVISMAKYADLGREKFCKALLHNTSRELGQSFTISSGSLGKCWIISCSDISMKSKEHFCSKCGYCCKSCDSKEKYLDIDKRSMCSNSIPFSEFFIN